MKRISISSEQGAVSEATLRVDRWLASDGVDEDARDRTQLVVAEILNNIAEHAYQGCATGPIEIALSMQDDALDFTFTDQGVPLSALPSGEMADPCEMALENLPEGGFGWPLIHLICNDVSYARIGAENKLKIRVNI